MIRTTLFLLVVATIAGCGHSVEHSRREQADPSASDGFADWESDEGATSSAIVSNRDVAHGQLVDESSASDVHADGPVATDPRLGHAQFQDELMDEVEAIFSSYGTTDSPNEFENVDHVDR